MDGRRVDGVFQPERFLALGAGVGTAALRMYTDRRKRTETARSPTPMIRSRGACTRRACRCPAWTFAWRTRRGEGYFHTGDLGLIGDDGRVRFRGRLKEMIKTGGINVAPLEVWACSPSIRTSSRHA